MGSFQWNLTISAMARLFYYGSVCAALPVLRRKQQVPEAQFRLPAGNIVAALAVITSLFLFPRLDRTSTAVLVVLVFCVIANSWWVAKNATRETS